MPLRYKINVLEALKAKGYNTNRLRTERILGEATIQKIRDGELVSHKNLETLCRLLQCQPGDIIEYIEEEG